MLMMIAPRERPLGNASPQHIAAIREACVAINRLPDPLSRVLRLAITGSSPAHIARVTGLSLGKVEELRSAFVRQIDQSGAGNPW